MDRNLTKKQVRFHEGLSLIILRRHCCECASVLCLMCQVKNGLFGIHIALSLKALKKPAQGLNQPTKGQLFSE